MKIITSGFGNTDIDALACAIAYHELLALENQEVGILISQDYTVSVTASIKNWGLPTNATQEEAEATDTEFILVDFSDPHKLLIGVDKDKIIQIFDHHFFGFESFWFELLGDYAIIEAVGSCASLIWREYQVRGMLEKMSQRVARFLYAAVISNTLNLQAGVCVKLDRDAAADLKIRAGLPTNWIVNYYHEVEQTVLANPLPVIKADTRLYEINNETWVIGQLELWDGDSFISENFKQLQQFIEDAETENAKYGFLTIVSIKDGMNYILTKNEASKQVLAERLKLRKGKISLETNKLLLRKEIFKILNS